MPFFNLFRDKSSKPDPNKAGFICQPADTSGLVVTNELDKALKECKATVERIANECRENNCKFRDVEFDLENDWDACLNGLVPFIPPGSYGPSDVLRVTQIFDEPHLFVNGADSNDILQGNVLGDCWFLSALSTMTTSKGLVEKFFVACDEEVGIYGFIFFRDDHWVHVIIDDLLFTVIPKFEQLPGDLKNFYRNDKELYNKSARKGNHSLFFAKSATEGETWVPLIEKAYAKLHGDYGSLNGGLASEAIEDLTGGISTFIQRKDILDVDKFWKDELMKATTDRLFGCSFNGLNVTKFGLFGNHAYSVLRAVEANGKRWLVIRNPWGKSEWTGPWSDGSKEWNAESFDLLPALQHSFGNDGQFVMEYSDFLECWDIIERTLLTNDGNWITSSHWLRVVTRPIGSAWSYGDVYFTVTVPEQPEGRVTVIVLSQLDSRYFKNISGRFEWSFDFLLFKQGQREPFAVSSKSLSRSVNLERKLEAGDYVVHVRLDRRPNKLDTSNPQDNLEDFEGSLNQPLPFNQRKLTRVRTAKAESQSIASNFNPESMNMAIPVKELAGLNLAEMEKKANEKKKEAEAAAMHANLAPVVTKTVTTTITTTSSDGTSTVVVSNENVAADVSSTRVEISADDASAASPFEDGPAVPAEASAIDTVVPTAVGNVPPSWEDEQEAWEDDTIFLGLRVYTDKNGGAATIGGQLRHEMDAALANLAVKA
ncbi:hypothetical protein B0H19DRAFT_1250969 [Mycena capillaripes]|nr:hypothetical protein B0H19DRAFT_1250969 [Mycena capillaripes]